MNILKYDKYFYGVGYQEPRLFDRDTLLKESFDDAARRWKKNISNSEERLFFIEDTSVRIEALCDEDREVPGVDIKYWMQSNSFETLDQSLRDRGNNRTASVSSHIILFLTDSLKKKLGTTEEFIVFHSTTNGRIVEIEQTFETQLLYPWLDNKSFNKWFVPDGFSSPISTLNIEDADTVDFRKGAFQQMMFFLEENGLIDEPQSVVPDWTIPFDDIFLICGPTCSGKTTIGKFLVDRYGYYHIEASDFMSLRYHETLGARSSVDKHQFAAEVLRAEPLFVVDRVLEYINVRGIYDKLVITGFRTKSEVVSFMTRYHSQRVKLIYLNANEEIRYERWMRRKRDTGEFNKDRFKIIDQVQIGMGVREIALLDGIELLDNNRDGLNELYEIFAAKYTRDMKQLDLPDFDKIVEVEKMSLEKAILSSLAISSQEEDTAYFTTTEIAKRINTFFCQFSKNKNNVSRYFNQAFYLYYEIQNEGVKVKYKLSPIGYSEAMLLIRKVDG